MKYVTIFQLDCIYRWKYDKERPEEKDDDNPLHSAPVAQQLGAPAAPAPAPLLVLVPQLGRLTS